MRYSLLILAFSIVALAGCGKNTPVPGVVITEVDDLKLVAGNWGIVKFDAIGDEAPPPGLFERSLIEIKGNIAIAKDNGQESHGLIKLDPSKSPKELDMTSSDKDGTPRELIQRDGTKKVETFKAIYKIEGDTVVIAISSPEYPRPTEFKPIAAEKDKKDSEVFVITFKKLSDEEATKRATPKPKPTFSTPSPKK